jgi:hypothetical protein
VSDPTQETREAIAAGDQDAVQQAARDLCDRMWADYVLPPDARPCEDCGVTFAPGFSGAPVCLLCVVKRYGSRTLGDRVVEL